MSSVAPALAISTSDALSSDVFFFRYPHSISLKKVDSKIATVLQRLIVVLIIYLYLHLCQKHQNNKEHEKAFSPIVNTAASSSCSFSVCAGCY